MDMFEEAEAINDFIRNTGTTQDSVASALGCSQSYVANKLRLLRLPDDERRTILGAGLTERHARALIRIADRETRMRAEERMIEKRMNVATAEEFVETVLCASFPLPTPEAEREPANRPGKFEVEFKRRLLLRDMRLFYNSIDHAVDSVRSCGFCVLSTRTRTADGIHIDIFIKNEPEEKCFT